MKRRVLQIFSEKTINEKHAASFHLIPNDKVILNEFPELVEGNEVNNLLTFSRVNSF
jgi:hypothetical protein